MAECPYKFKNCPWYYPGGICDYHDGYYPSGARCEMRIFFEETEKQERNMKGIGEKDDL